MTKKNNAVLLEVYTPGYSSMTIKRKVDGKDTRFKLWIENGNSYCRGGIKLQTSNGDWADMYHRDDIEGFKYIAYHEHNDYRIVLAKENINLMLELIERVF